MTAWIRRRIHSSSESASFCRPVSRHNLTFSLAEKDISNWLSSVIVPYFIQNSENFEFTFYQLFKRDGRRMGCKIPILVKKRKISPRCLPIIKCLGGCGILATIIKKSCEGRGGGVSGLSNHGVVVLLSSLLMFPCSATTICSYFPFPASTFFVFCLCCVLRTFGSEMFRAWFLKNTQV